MIFIVKNLLKVLKQQKKATNPNDSQCFVNK